MVATESNQLSQGALSQWATFRDPDLEEAFRRDGFVVVDFAAPTVVEEILAGYFSLDSGINEGYYPSFMSSDLDYKARTHRLVSDSLWPTFDQYIDGYEPLLGVFMVKHPGLNTEVPPHQDWIVADESLRPTMNVWLPLTPLTDETGQMRVLPGSHHWLEGLRGSPSFPTQWEAIYQRVRDELMIPVHLRPGQAMLYDIRVLHGTPPNLSGDTRVVTSLYAIPEGTSPIHYYRSPEGDVAGYEVPSDFCTTFTIGAVPEGEQFTGFVNYSVQPLSFEEFAERYAASRA
jgi:hypothetical protein